ncbi:hypothetical protein MKK84_17200 [Methylobacterium sp. E-065]|uniref:hypothetical protein n=1 Tax=Methylobacterium sp. E-065 TaxID=2836583 RepID=UPI001FB9C4D5|nr:hypothetical protein [Methylobacterium sp. E-065]MCJ2019161.1 hypothetical protein [Methylobacterium sp. E-065]
MPAKYRDKSRKIRKYYSDNEEQRDRPLLFENSYLGDLHFDLRIGQLPTNISEHALRCVLGEALLRNPENSWISYSLNSNKYIGVDRYGGPDFRRLKVKGATEYAASLGLICIDAGKSWAQDGYGKQSRFTATPTLIQMAGLEPAIIKHPRELIRLKDEKHTLIGYVDTDFTIELRNDLREWNDHISQFHIWVDDPHVKWTNTGVVKICSQRENGGHFFIRPDSVAMHRVFNDNSFKLGGRAFGPFWQSLPKSMRKNVRIDNSYTASGDYSCSHLRLAYAEAGLDPGVEDGYAIPGYEDPTGRSLVKIATNIAINCKNNNQARRAVSDQVAWMENGSLGPQKGNTNHKDAVKVLEAILDKHHRISEAFYSGSGLRFMAIEARILADVARAARQRGIVTLPVHDELICQSQHIDIVKDLMTEKWSETVPVRPIVK